MQSCIAQMVTEDKNKKSQIEPTYPADTQAAN
jgi:hypothetical protein